MKPNLKTAAISLILGLSWLLPQCGQAFYNPNAGRWISRDPLGEAGGASLNMFCKNDPLNRSDRHGLKDFEWKPPIYDPDHPPVRIGDGVQYGSTSWRSFQPVVKMYQVPGKPCCYGLMFDGEYAQLAVWWARGDEEAKTDELHHVSWHFYPAYLDFKSVAKSYFPPCKTRRLAECLAGAIEGPLAEEYTSFALAVALDYDCRSYGGEICNAARIAAERYLGASQRAREAISKCFAAPQ